MRVRYNTRIHGLTFTQGEKVLDITEMTLEWDEPTTSYHNVYPTFIGEQPEIDNENFNEAKPVVVSCNLAGRESQIELIPTTLVRGLIARMPYTILHTKRAYHTKGWEFTCGK